MQHRTLITAAVLFAAAPFSTAGGGWTSIFDGTLKGWDGDPKFWSVKDGAITGTTTEENKTLGNTFIIYTGDSEDSTPASFADFELKLEYRITGHNSGIQYRSFKLPGEHDGWRLGGYQADFDAKKQWAGTNYGEKFRGILAKRGEKATLTGTKLEKRKNGATREVVEREVESLGDPDELVKRVKDAPEWNEMHIIAKGHHLIQKINGVTMSEVIDNDAKNRRASGLIGVQLHQGPPMTVQVRNVRVKTGE